MDLVTGQPYDVRKFRFIGWTAGDGIDTRDYSLPFFFDLDHGAYLGPDHHGIEPIVELETEEEL